MNPFWDDSLLFKLKDDDRFFQIKVFNKGSVDGLIGEATVDLNEEILIEGKQQKEFSLTYEQKDAGKLIVSIQYSQDEKMLKQADDQLEDLQSAENEKKPKVLTEEEKKAQEEQSKKDKEIVDFSDMKAGEYFLHVYVEETVQITNPTDSEKTQDLIIKS